jgi:hypothetical protein
MAILFRDRSDIIGKTPRADAAIVRAGRAHRADRATHR